MLNGECCSRTTLWWARLVGLSVFGPYLAGGRLEQFAVFASAAAVLLAGWPRMMAARRVPPAPLVILLGALCAVILIGTAWRPTEIGSFGADPGSHGLAYFLMPLALIIVTWYWTLTAPAAELMRVIAQVIVGALTVNAVISAIQLATGNVVVLSFLPRFWDALPAGLAQAGSVASEAAGNERFTGIFNQPAEAGLAYGVALFCLIYLAQRKAMRPAVVALCAVAVFGGGVLTVSKMFLLIALPAAVVMILVGRRARTRTFAAVAAASVALRLAAGAGLLPAWPVGAAAIRALATGTGGGFTTYTAGRYGAGGSLGPAVADVLRSSPWYGFGSGGLWVAYDSLWLEVLAVAGIAGVILIVLVLGALAFRWVSMRRTQDQPGWLLAGAVLILAAAGSAGLPTLTANRAGTLLWLVMGLLIATQVPHSGVPGWRPAQLAMPDPVSAAGGQAGMRGAPLSRASGVAGRGAGP